MSKLRPIRSWRGEHETRLYTSRPGDGTTAAEKKTYSQKDTKVQQKKVNEAKKKKKDTEKNVQNNTRDKQGDGAECHKQAVSQIVQVALSDVLFTNDIWLHASLRPYVCTFRFAWRCTLNSGSWVPTIGRLQLELGASMALVERTCCVHQTEEAHARNIPNVNFHNMQPASK